MAIEQRALGVKDRDTPLHLAINRGYENIVSILLEAGDIDVNAQNTDDATPLHVAAWWGQVDIARILLENGAKVNPINGDRKTPYELAKTTEVRNLLQDSAFTRLRWS